jgi:hypothetical protein
MTDAEVEDYRAEMDHIKGRKTLFILIQKMLFSSSKM